MKLTFNHIAFAKLADLAENRLTPDEQQEARAHLSACQRCSAQFARLGQVIGLMRADEGMDAPPEVVARAIHMFRSRALATESNRSLVRRVMAALSFDSRQMSPAFGVRSGQATTRQLLFSAGENDLDLRVTQSGEGFVVSGQVLGGNCAGGQIELEGESGKSRAQLNEQCEFRLAAVAAGSYRLLLRLKDSEVEVPELELRA